MTAETDYPGAPSEQVLLEAAQWFAILGDAPSEQDNAAWRLWLQADARHRVAWSRVESLSRRFDVLPDGADRHAAVQALGEVRRTAGRRRVLRGLAGLGVFGTAGWLFHEQLWQAWRADAQTGVGEQQALHLQDGTQLRLNTDTLVQVQYGENQRVVRLLRGELMVVTARDSMEPARPWRLELPVGSLRPVGTRFSARLVDEDCLLRVFEGAVDVLATRVAQPVRARAGEQVRFNVGRVGQILPVPAGADAWTQGMLVVDGWSLAEFCRELARYQNGWLTCADEVATLRLVGAFPLGDLNHIYRTLEQTLPVRVQHPLPGWARVVAV